MPIVSGVPLQIMEKEDARLLDSLDVLTLELAHAKFTQTAEVASMTLVANGVLKTLNVLTLIILALLLNQYSILQLLALAILTEIAVTAELDPIASGV